mgnify:FL=1|jgi:hypothetical protein
MAHEEQTTALARIAHIDAMFEGASRWGSWMVMYATEREVLAKRLRAVGHQIEDKWLARGSDGSRVD